MKKELRQELIDFSLTTSTNKSREFHRILVDSYLEQKSMNSNASAESQSVSSNESEKVVCTHNGRFQDVAGGKTVCLNCSEYF